MRDNHLIFFYCRRIESAAKLDTIMPKYQAMTQTQLALCAGVSRRTLYNWLQSRQKHLRKLGVQPNAKALPPAAVKYICEAFCIDIN